MGSFFNGAWLVVAGLLLVAAVLFLPGDFWAYFDPQPGGRLESGLAMVGCLLMLIGVVQWSFRAPRLI